MGHIVPTPAGGYRANWRDAAGRQRAKIFTTKREAKTYLAEVESAVSRGLTSTHTPAGSASAPTRPGGSTQETTKSPRQHAIRR
jgi:hypothetical protein